VFGGGNTAVEEALYLANFASKAYVTHRHDKFHAEPILVDRMKAEVAEGRIVLHTFMTLDEALGDAGGVTGVRINSVTDGSTIDITLQGCLIAVNDQPNTDIFKGQQR